MSRIGIYPGAFDPIHEGHIAFACAVGRQFKLDKIFFLVEPRPRRKQGVRALEHRIAMTQAAIEDDQHLGVIVLEEARFAIDSTWPKIKAMFGNSELYMLMGERNLDHIAHWPQIDEFVEAAPSFIIGTRSNETKLDLQDRLYTMQQTKAFPFVYHLIPLPLPTVSSRTIRSGLRKGTESKYLPAEALKYARQHRLYRRNA